MSDLYDIAIIGGGVNGCGVARDAAGRGLKVVLFEQGDLAGATSSASTKLIHGGLRYLEHYEFRLVREALLERGVLMKIAPHNVRPLRFILPHHRELRPRWMLRAGLFLYDALSGGGLPRARALDLRSDVTGVPLKPAFSAGFAYWDCWTDDARLVVLNAKDAARRGADVRVRTRVTGAARTLDEWTLSALGPDGPVKVRACAVINAAGAWVNGVLDAANAKPAAGVRLVQGSHIVVRKLFDHDAAYIFQQGDGRIVFAIPYEDEFTLIGTTDQEWSGDPGEVRASAAEIEYLCAAANRYFKAQIAPADVVWTYSGVRALFDDGASAAQEVTRDYVLQLDKEGAPLLSVYGGKITTYRRLAEAALAALPHGGGDSWTKTAPLPGGDFTEPVADLAVRLAAKHPFITPGHALRLARAYGTDAFAIFDRANDLGEVFCADLTAREVDYLIAEEWARSAEDVLWRRTKLGLRADAAAIARLDGYIKARCA